MSKKERLETITQRLRQGEELGVYDMIAMFRVHCSTVYRDMDELERYEGVERRQESVDGSRGKETVWYMPCGGEAGAAHA